MAAKLVSITPLFYAIYAVLASIEPVLVAIAASFSVDFSVAAVIDASKPLTLVSSAATKASVFSSLSMSNLFWYVRYTILFLFYFGKEKGSSNGKKPQLLLKGSRA